MRRTSVKEKVYREEDVFEITKIHRSLKHYVVHGKCVKGCFTLKDKIKIRENSLDILEGCIDDIKTFDKIQISSTLVDQENTIILYLYIEDTDLDVEITTNHIITK